MSKRYLFLAAVLQIIGVSATLLIEGCSSGASTNTGSGTETVSLVLSGPSTDRLAASVQFAATVSGSTNQTVAWQMNGVTGGSAAAGTVTSTGLYTAPVVMPPGAAVSITAVSAVSSNASGTVSLGLQNPLPTIAAGSATEVGTTLNYSLSVTGSGMVPTSTISVGGLAQTTTFVSTGQLTATVAVPAGTSSISAAVINPDPGGSTSSPITVTLPEPAVTVSVSGASTLRLGATAQFAATVSGSSDQAVTWQVNGVTGGNASLGTISPTGLYAPPGTVPSSNGVTISAVSQVNPNDFGSTALALENPLPVILSGTALQVANTTNCFLVDLLGTGFVPTSVINVGSALTTTYVSPTEIQATMPVGLSVNNLSASVTNANPGGSTSGAYNITIAGKTTTAAAAARLLDQATFGPTAADIQHVESEGLDAWLNEQFAAAPTLIPLYDPTNAPVYCLSNGQATCVQTPWWQNAITGPDQLRQRIAFAFSQMFVTSMLENGVDQPAMPQYQNVLVDDAFGNFQQLMHDVTLSPEMGLYLNMLNSAKPQTGEIANENYARENMQLFTIGLDLLNSDGSLQLDGSGNPIPAYTEAQVQAFARIYTGWTWATAAGTPATSFPYNTPNYASPMLAVESQHDPNSKTLLNGLTTAANQTAETDLGYALGNLFTHQNIAPFICKELIQHFVESNPSPAYVSRIAAVFANDGTGIRGNMKAVFRAIFEDDEARAGDTNPNFNGGHLREPVLFLSAMLRGLSFTNTSTTGAWYSLSGPVSGLSENPLSSASVFNFFPPNYTIPIVNLNAPEFGIENTATSILRQTLANQIVFNQVSGFSVDLSATGTLGQMASNPTTLVNYLGMLLMHSQMPTGMQTLLINTITPITNNAERVRMAVYLIVTSSNYKVIQ